MTRKGGTITTCASTSGYMHEYDNRYLWMNLKRIIVLALRQLPRVVGGQPAHRQGQDPPDPVEDLPPRRGRPGRLDVHHNAHQGKVGVLCLAPEEGLGVRDGEFRAQHEGAINRFRGV